MSSVLLGIGRVERVVSTVEEPDYNNTTPYFVLSWLVAMILSINKETNSSLRLVYQ